MWFLLCAIYSTYGFTLDFKPIPTLQMFLRPPTFLFHSVAQVQNPAIILSSLFFSPPTFNPLTSLANSTFRIWPLLPSCPHLSFDYWASILTDLILPAIVFPLTIGVLFGKDKSGDATVLCLNQPWNFGPHLPFQPWIRASPAHSLRSVTLAGLGTELESFPSQGFAVTVPLPSTRPLWLLVQVSTQVSLPQSGPLISLSKTVPPSLSIPLSCAYSLPRITNDGHFSKCLLLSLLLDGDCPAEPVCSHLLLHLQNVE